MCLAVTMRPSGTVHLGQHGLGAPGKLQACGSRHAAQTRPMPGQDGRARSERRRVFWARFTQCITAATPCHPLPNTALRSRQPPSHNQVHISAQSRACTSSSSSPSAQSMLLSVSPTSWLRRRQPPASLAVMSRTVAERRHLLAWLASGHAMGHLL